MHPPQPPAVAAAAVPAWTRAGRGEWLDDGVCLRCRPDPKWTRSDLIGLAIATAAALVIAFLTLRLAWWNLRGAEGSTGVRVFLSALGLPLLVLGAFGVRATYRHYRDGPPEDVFDRGTRTFCSGMGRARPLLFDDISHVALRQASGILYVLEVHPRSGGKPALSRLRLTRPTADTLAGLAAQVVGVPFNRAAGG